MGKKSFVSVMSFPTKIKTKNPFSLKSIIFRTHSSISPSYAFCVYTNAHTHRVISINIDSLYIICHVVKKLIK